MIFQRVRWLARWLLDVIELGAENEMRAQRFAVWMSTLLIPMVVHAAPVTLQFETGANRWVSLPQASINAPHSESGFITSGGAGSDLGIGDTNWCSPTCPDNGTRALRASRAGTVAVVRRADGGLFDFLGFDGAESFAGFPNTWAAGIQVTGFFGSGGSFTQLFSLDQINDGNGAVVDFQSFTASSQFSDIARLELSGVGGGGLWSADNLRLDVAAAALPLPATLSLALAGLLALGATRRRR